MLKNKKKGIFVKTLDFHLNFQQHFQSILGRPKLTFEQPHGRRLDSVKMCQRRLDRWLSYLVESKYRKYEVFVAQEKG